MIYPLLPVFLATVLGASATFDRRHRGSGGVDGGAAQVRERLVVGPRARRKPLVVAGLRHRVVDAPAVATRAESATQVLRDSRRATASGRGSARRATRSSPTRCARDRGRAFGFHRAADHAGRGLGPLLAFALLRGAACRCARCSGWRRSRRRWRCSCSWSPCARWRDRGHRSPRSGRRCRDAAGGSWPTAPERALPATRRWAARFCAYLGVLAALHARQLDRRFPPAAARRSSACRRR